MPGLGKKIHNLRLLIISDHKSDRLAGKRWEKILSKMGEKLIYYYNFAQC